MEPHPVGGKCLAYHGPLIYEAKVLRRHVGLALVVEVKDGTEPVTAASLPVEFHKKTAYFLHYNGWRKSWDEWVEELRVMAVTKENVAKQKLLRADATRSRKRAAEEPPKTAAAPPVSRTKKDSAPQVRLAIPLVLRKALVDDWERVTSLNQLVQLPCARTVRLLLEEYRGYRGGDVASKEIANDTVEGLLLYFDRALGVVLLYRFERQQYLEVYLRGSMADVYGAAHLLRLLVALPGLVAQTTMDQQSVGVMMGEVEVLLKWLGGLVSGGLVDAYEDASPAYLHTMRGE